jgi:hypothetical protein
LNSLTAAQIEKTSTVTAIMQSRGVSGMFHTMDAGTDKSATWDYAVC